MLKCLNESINMYIVRELRKSQEPRTTHNTKVSSLYRNKIRGICNYNLL